jgi:antitoxin (DNA-binding transcriptional repressor) of toxin-antitoxin stability system
MKISISKAREKLPQLIKELQKNANITYEITVHNSVVAELKAAPKIEPGLAAKKLQVKLEEVAKAQITGTEDVSTRIDHYLYKK